MSHLPTAPKPSTTKSAAATTDPPLPNRGPSSWATLSRLTPPPPPPRIPLVQLPHHNNNNNPHPHHHPHHKNHHQHATAPPSTTSTILTSSSVSSPSAPDLCTAAEVDELLEGIDRVRIDDLWTTPRPPSNHPPSPSQSFPPGLFAPPRDTPTAFPPFRSVHLAHQHSLHFAAPAAGSNVTAVEAVAPIRCALDVSRDEEEGEYRDDDGDNRDDDVEFPRLFKVYPCTKKEVCMANGDFAECVRYHSIELDRRRLNVNLYKPHMCRFVEEAGGCRKGDCCPFSHNDFERRYHPDRFGKETCRDFLRGNCPRRYCTFRHEVSSKVEVALYQMEAMNDKEVLQLVLKIDEIRGKALCEKLLRRFGHGKKHSGWKLEGFNPHGREDQKVKFVTARVEEVKRKLRAAGEKKWAASLKTSSLRDMMSGVRKVAEEVRERCREGESFAENGSEVHRMIRNVFSNTNWSCHSQEGDNPFLVTPENQNEAMTSLEKLVQLMLAPKCMPVASSRATEYYGKRSVTEGNDGVGNAQMRNAVRPGGAKSGREEVCSVSQYEKGMSGEEFGMMEQGFGEGRRMERRTQAISTLWAFPSSIGQMSTA